MISLKLHNFKSLKDSNLIFSADIENRILRVLSKGLFKKNNTQLTILGNRIYIKSYKIHRVKDIARVHLSIFISLLGLSGTNDNVSVTNM